MSEDHGKNPLTSFHVSVEKNIEKYHQNINCDSCNISSSQPLRRQFLAARDPEDKFSEGLVGGGRGNGGLNASNGADHERLSNGGAGT